MFFDLIILIWKLNLKYYNFSERPRIDNWFATVGNTDVKIWNKKNLPTIQQEFENPKNYKNCFEFMQMFYNFSLKTRAIINRDLPDLIYE